MTPRGRSARLTAAGQRWRHFRRPSGRGSSSSAGAGQMLSMLCPAQLLLLSAVLAVARPTASSSADCSCACHHCLKLAARLLPAHRCLHKGGWWAASPACWPGQRCCCPRAPPRPAAPPLPFLAAARRCRSLTSAGAAGSHLWAGGPLRTAARPAGCRRYRAGTGGEGSNASGGGERGAGRGKGRRHQSRVAVREGGRHAPPPLPARRSSKQWATHLMGSWPSKALPSRTCSISRPSLCCHEVTAAPCRYSSARAPPGCCRVAFGRPPAPAENSIRPCLP